EYAGQQNLNVSKQVVDGLIRQQADFQVDGVFNQKLFVRTLNNSNLTPPMYYRSVREEMMMTQVAAAFISSEFTSDQELTRLVKLMQQRRSFSFATVTQQSVKESIPTTTELLEEYYQENADSFMTLERVAIEYIELSKKSVASSIEPTEDAIKAAFELEVDGAPARVQRVAAHILIKADGDDTKQSLEKAQSLQQRLAEGEGFTELAKQYSQDKGSAAAGGQLGITDGDTFPVAFEAALADLSVGEVSDPVETDAGYHLIKLVDLYETEPMVLTENRERISQQLKSAEAEQQYISAAEELANLAFESSDLIEPSEELNLEIQKTALFDRSGGDGILGDRRVIAAAFLDEVLIDGNNSTPIDLGDDRLLVLRVSQHEKPRQLSFVEAESRVKEDYISERATEQVGIIGEQAYKGLLAGKTASELAEKYHFEWRPYTDVARTVQEVPQEILRHAYSMARPTDEKPTTSTLDMRNGNVSLVVLTKVSDPEIDMSEQERNRFRQSLSSYAGQTQFEVLTKTLRDTADIRVY
ncbi:MAG: peptidylprolyl isomerase, partial [Pseudomonadales bacterium]|nr:peptidylprolyl isomerase [Pseudomonadales bacterium]